MPACGLEHGPEDTVQLRLGALEGIRQAVAAVQEANHELQKQRLLQEETALQLEKRKVDKERLEKERLEAERVARVQRRAAARRRANVGGGQTDDASAANFQENEDAQILEAAPDETSCPLALPREDSDATAVEHWSSKLLEAKAQLASCLLAAKEAGASEQDLLQAGQPPKPIDLDHEGESARKARKLRQFLEKERQEKARAEEERARAARVAQAAAARRAKEAEEKERADIERAARVAQAVAERRARANGCAEAEAVEKERTLRIAKAAAERRKRKGAGECLEELAPSREPEGDPNGDTGDRPLEEESAAAYATLKVPFSDASTNADAAPDTMEFQPASSIIVQSAGRFGGMSCSTSTKEVPQELSHTNGKRHVARLQSRSRSRSRGPGIGEVREVKSLSALLGKGDGTAHAAPVSQKAHAAPLKIADIPVGFLLGASAGLSGGPGAVASDLSTGGGEVCRSFRLGLCLRGANCKFRHIHRM